MLDFIEITNPFPGLRPFEMVENNLFFGRDGQSDQLLERLRRTRFLAVVGTSGSGKSSLIRAGLLPALYGGLMGDAGSAWRIAIMRPGSDPIGNLAAALSDDKVLGAGSDQMTDAARRTSINRTMLRRSTFGLVECVRQARMAEHENLLVVVDQFEELFRFKKVSDKTHAEDEAAAFVKLLLEATRSEDVPVYIVLTMRSDFLGDCAQFYGLPEAINSGQYLIPRMTRSEKREAITGPVAVGGGEITPPLVNRLLNDMGDNPDHLPTLQHALMRSWEYWTATRRDGEPLDLAHYEAVGGMANALSQHADEAYDELADADDDAEIAEGDEPRISRRQQIAERLFKSLTEKGADNREIRRPTRLGDICAITGASEQEVVEVIDVFRRAGRSFLMPPAGVALDADSVIDISHESLIRGWGKLKKWVNEEAESARIYRRLSDAATRKAQGREDYWGGPNLLLTLDWRDRNQPNAAWAHRYRAESDSEFDDAIRFLEDSRADRDAKLAASERQRAAEIERERQELERAQAFAAQQAQAARRLRGVLVALFAILLLAVGSAAYAWTARQQAIRSEKVAIAAKLETDKQAARIAELLKNEQVNLANERLAKDDAEKQRIAADEQKEKALEATKAALRAKSEAEAQTRRANELKIVADKRAGELQRSNTAMLIAQQGRNAAEMGRARAREQIEKSQAANKAFRDAAATYQRDPDEHSNVKFIEAVEKFEEIGEQDGVAASYLQLGYINLNSKKKESIADGVRFFSKAASKYFAMGQVESAAATYETSGDLLLKPIKNSSASGDDESSTSSQSFSAAQYAIKSEPTKEEKQAELKRKQEELQKRQEEVIKTKRLAAAQYKQAIAYYVEAGKNVSANETLGKLFEFYGNWDDKNDKREAINYYAEIVKTATEKSITLGLKVKMGVLHYDLGEDAAGDKYFDEFIEGAKAGAEESDEAQLFYTIGHLAFTTGQYRAADKYMEKAGQAYLRKNDQTEASLLFENFGDAYLQLQPPQRKEYARALNNYKKSLAIHESTGAAVQQVRLLFNIANVYREQSDDQSAVEVYKRALTSYRAVADNLKSYDDLTKAAVFLKDVNENELALKFYQEAFKAAKAATYPMQPQQANALENVGLMYSLMDNPVEALKAYQEAAEIYRQLNDQKLFMGIQPVINNLKKRAAGATR